jgi:PAS domain S-box-containing protein
MPDARTDLRAELARQQALVQTLSDREERYRKIIEASNDAILLLDSATDQILEANPVACRMLGYSQDELLALTVSAIHPHEMPQMTQFAQSVITQGTGWTNELSCHTKTGAVLPAEISASVVEIDGRSYLLALVRDTSERKVAEARVRREAARADALARVAARLNAQLDLGAVLNAICEETAQALAVPAAVLLFFDERQQLFYPAATFGLPSAFMERYIPNPRAVYDQYPQSGAQIVVPNLRKLPNLVNADLFEEYGIHAIALAGLNREDHLLGVLSAYTTDADHSFSEDDINLLRSLADLGAQAVRNAILFQAEQKRSEQFRTLSEVGRHITSILDTDELIRQIAQSVRRIFDSSQVVILLIEEDALVMVEPAAQVTQVASPPHTSANGLGPRTRIPFADSATPFPCVAGRVAAHGQTILVRDLERDERGFQSFTPGTRSEIAVPMKVQQRVIGVLNVQSEVVDAYDEMDLIVLQSLADQAAVALENAQLYEQTRQLAILEERQRLARELHDSVTQALYGMTLYTAAASDLLALGDLQTAANHLTIMQETAQLALSEMRLLIFQLRSPTLRDGLASALQERLESVEKRSGLNPHFISSGIEHSDVRVHEELYRIAQEALNNVLKHARARNVYVRLHQTPSAITLEVQDDGVGFDHSLALRAGGMGLRGMQERVDQLGAVLAIESQPNRGTTIRVEVRVG